MTVNAQAPRRALQSEYVPLILRTLANFLQKDKFDLAIDLLDSLGITNEVFKEHLHDLCMNRKVLDEFEKLSSQQKAAFTRQWNQGHKDPTKGVRGKK